MYTQLFLTTNQMAHLIGKNKNFLKLRKGTVFIKDIHYFEPNGHKDPFWKVEALLQWIQGSEAANDILTQSILQKMA